MIFGVVFSVKKAVAARQRYFITWGFSEANCLGLIEAVPTEGEDIIEVTIFHQPFLSPQPAMFPL